MHVTGRCHCGQITYEAEVDPDRASICHCTDCQTLSGTAFRTAVFSGAGAFRLLTGTLKVYVKTAENGNRREQAFCPECGTPIYAAAPGPEPKVHLLRIGSVDQRDSLVPRVQIWSRSRQGWLPSLESIPCVAMQPPPAGT